jgi:hypothetical protein
MKIFLPFDQAKTSQLDKQYNTIQAIQQLFWTTPVCMAASVNNGIAYIVGHTGLLPSRETSALYGHGMVSQHGPRKQNRK